MIALTEKYAPRKVADFVGLAAPKAMFSKLIADPYQSAWLSLGSPGNGKTAMAFVVAKALNAAIHHVPARQCDLEQVERICRIRSPGQRNSPCFQFSTGQPGFGTSSS